MITSRSPTDWSDLQKEVASILSDCGFESEVEKRIELARGSATVDVYGVDSVSGRKHVVIAECKYWDTNVPQSVVHAFRTVVIDVGAHQGLVIAKKGFQPGSFAAAEYSNIQLLSWEEFQQEFEEQWCRNHLVPVVTRRLDRLFSFTEPLAPTSFPGATEDDKRALLHLWQEHHIFGEVMMAFTSYLTEFTKTAAPKLPLKTKLPPNHNIPTAIAEATGYREFLAAALEHGDAVVEAFRGVRQRRAAQNSS